MSNVTDSWRLFCVRTQIRLPWLTNIDLCSAFKNFRINLPQQLLPLPTLWKSSWGIAFQICREDRHAAVRLLQERTQRLLISSSVTWFLNHIPAWLLSSGPFLLCRPLLLKINYSQFPAFNRVEWHNWLSDVWGLVWSESNYTDLDYLFYSTVNTIVEKTGACTKSSPTLGNILEDFLTMSLFCSCLSFSFYSELCFIKITNIKNKNMINCEVYHADNLFFFSSKL